MPPILRMAAITLDRPDPHLCFDVADLDAAEAALLALDATRPVSQPDPARHRVPLDPAGHPFCLSSKS